MKPSIKSTALMAAAGALLLLVSPMRAFTQDKGTVQERSGVSLQTVQGSFREVAKKVTPVVVEINVTQVVTQQTPQNDTPFGSPSPSISLRRAESRPEDIPSVGCSDPASSCSTRVTATTC